MPSIFRTGLLVTVFSLGSLGSIGVAHAQAARTWVSGVGDDTNPCSRTAPCQTFAGAILKTAPTGVVSALDPGDFGPATITTALTIDGHPRTGGVITAGTTGIRVNAGATDRVVLRGLSIHGDGTGSGVTFVSGHSLLVDDCLVSNFADGIDVQPSAGGSLHLADVVSIDNKSAGIRVRSAAGPSFATIAHSRFEGNVIGVFAGAGARVSMYDSVASRNGTGILATLDASGGIADVNLEHGAASDNGIGVQATAAAGSAVVRLSKVLATDNTTPTVVSGTGSILSFGNNRLDFMSTIALSCATPSQSGPAGKSVAYPVTSMVKGLLAKPVALACTGLPPGSSCKLGPASLPAATAKTDFTVEVITTGPKTAMNLLAPSSRVPSGMAAFFALPLLAGFGLRRRLRVPLACMFLVSFASLAACSSDSGSADSPTDPDASVDPGLDASAGDATGATGDGGVPVMPTPSGTYPFKVTATSGLVTTSLDLTLTVQ